MTEQAKKTDLAFAVAARTLETIQVIVLRHFLLIGIAFPIPIVSRYAFNAIVHGFHLDIFDCRLSLVLLRVLSVETFILEVASNQESHLKCLLFVESWITEGGIIKREVVILEAF